MTIPKTTEVAVNPFEAVQLIENALRSPHQEPFQDPGLFPPTMTFMLKKILLHIFHPIAGAEAQYDVGLERSGDRVELRVAYHPIFSREIIDLAIHVITLSAVSRMNDPIKSLPFIVVNTEEGPYSVVLTAAGVMPLLTDEGSQYVCNFTLQVQEYVCRSES